MKTYLTLPPFTNRQQEIITGSLLGDGWIYSNNIPTNNNSKFWFNNFHILLDIKMNQLTLN